MESAVVYFCAERSFLNSWIIFYDFLSFMNVDERFYADGVPRESSPPLMFWKNLFLKLTGRDIIRKSLSAGQFLIERAILKTKIKSTTT
jgi:hypothetical protein